jgi:hypothetical protein
MYAATSSSPIPGLVIFAVWLFVTFCGYNIGRKKGLGVLGTALGALLGLIGLFIISRASRSKTQPQVATVRSAQPSLVIQQPRAAQPPLPPPPPPLAVQRNDGWWPDPLGRHEHRYHDGSKWTDHVSDNGVTSVSSLTPIRTPHQ